MVTFCTYMKNRKLDVSYVVAHHDIILYIVFLLVISYCHRTILHYPILFKFRPTKDHLYRVLEVQTISAKNRKLCTYTTYYAYNLF